MRRYAFLSIVSCLLLVSPAGAAGNGRIAFVQGTEENTFEIWTMASDGTDQVRLTEDETSDDHVSFSPDGSKLLFASNRDGDWDIYVMDADGTNVVQLVNEPGTDAEPTWHPTGNKIAYETFRHDPDRILAEIRVVNADGSNDRRLTNNEMQEFNISWSPNGHRIAFSGNKFVDGFHVGIFTIDSQGGDRRRVTSNPVGGFIDGGPAWSPNGRWIAFTREVDAFAETFGYEIFKVRANGRRLQRLTRHKGTDQQPNWSPDGDYILYTSDFQIATIRAAGGGRTLLTSDEETAHYSPSWQAIPMTCRGSSRCSR